MGKGKIKVDIKGLKKLQENINKLSDQQVQEFINGIAKELAARLLAKVIKRTPVGQYPKSTGKKGGTLRRGWTAQQNGNGGGSDAQSYASSLQVNHIGNTYVIEIVNPVEYASYVEFGHRTRDGEGWVEGRFMLTISEEELEADAPKIIENRLKVILGGLFT